MVCHLLIDALPSTLAFIITFRFVIFPHYEGGQREASAYVPLTAVSITLALTAMLVSAFGTVDRVPNIVARLSSNCRERGGAGASLMAATPLSDLRSALKLSNYVSSHLSESSSSTASLHLAKSPGRILLSPLAASSLSSRESNFNLNPQT